VLLTNIIKIRLCAQIIYRVKYRVYYEKPLVLQPPHPLSDDTSNKIVLETL
jgi:hypothetical protein